MTAPPQSSDGGTNGDSPDSQDMLRRILVSVEKDRRRGRLEVLIAIVLSLATLASTWCGYQARQWGGAQGSNQSAADTAERQAAENTIVGLQLRTQDGLVLLEYWRAMREGDTATSENIRAHMRPTLRLAVDEAVAAGVLTNPEMPGPLQRPEYVLPAEQEASEQRERATAANAAAAVAGRTAGEYVLLTLMFASVLFFGGIAGTFTERRVRRALAFVALALFCVTGAMLAGLPPYNG